MKATQARQLKHYFHLDHFELKTLWICLLKYRKHFLLLYDFAINDNQMLATNQSYCFYHKVSYSSSLAGTHQLRQIQTEQSCCVSHFHHFLLVAIYLDQVSWVYYIIRQNIEFLNTSPSPIRPWTPTSAGCQKTIIIANECL